MKNDEKVSEMEERKESVGTSENEQKKTQKLYSRAVDSVDVVLLFDRLPDDLVQRQSAHEPRAIEEDELVARGERGGEGRVGLLGRRWHPSPEERRRRRLFLRRDAVAVYSVRSCSCFVLSVRRLRFLLVQKGHVPSPGVGVGRDVRRHRDDADEDGGQRVVNRSEDLRRGQDAAGPALRHEDATWGQLLLNDVFVELAGVELEARPSRDRVREVADDDVELAVGGGAQLRGGVVADQLEPRVREGHFIGGQVLLAEVTHHAVDVYHQASFHGGVPQDLARGRALSAAGDEDATGSAVSDQSRVHQHLVVDVFVCLCRLGLAVEEKYL